MTNAVQENDTFLSLPVKSNQPKILHVVTIYNELDEKIWLLKEKEFNKYTDGL